MALAETFAVTGTHGWLVLIAAIAFGAAVIVACVVPPRVYWAIAVAAGLCLWALSQLWH